MSLGPDSAATVSVDDGEAVEPRQAGTEEGPGDEPRLVRAVQEGDEDAFATLVDRYMDQAYAMALSILADEHDAQDGVQNAFIRALERIDQLRPGSPFGPWFYRVLRSTCLNLRRREKLRTHDPVPPSASGGTDPERELERTRARERVGRALEELPEMQRMAVMLYDIEGYEHAEIAEILGIARGTSRAHLHHGRKALRRALERQPEGTGDAERTGRDGPNDAGGGEAT